MYRDLAVVPIVAIRVVKTPLGSKSDARPLVVDGTDLRGAQTRLRHGAEGREIGWSGGL